MSGDLATWLPRSTQLRTRWKPAGRGIRPTVNRRLVEKSRSLAYSKTFPLPITTSVHLSVQYKAALRALAGTEEYDACCIPVSERRNTGDARQSVAGDFMMVCLVLRVDLCCTMRYGERRGRAGRSGRGHKSCVREQLWQLCLRG